MNTLVVLSALCAVAFGSAIVHETPAVAAARAAHIAAYAAAAGRVGVHGVHGIAPAHIGNSGFWAHGPAPIDPHTGVVVDTPEVAHTKAEHLATLAKARAGAHWNAWTGVPAISARLGYAGAWAHGPAPIDPHTGVVVDTPEVAHTKAEHLATVAKARAGAHWNAWTGVPAISAYLGYAEAWAHGPAPIDPHTGVVVDTPEVAHSKAEHLATAARARARAAHGVAAWDVTYGHGLHGIVKEGQWSPALWGDRTAAANALGVGHLNGQWNAALWGDKSAHGHRWRRSAIIAPAVVSPLAHSVAVSPAVTAISPLTTLHSTHAVSTLVAPAVTLGHLGLSHQTLHL